jgi:hypothetical protein
MPPNVKENASVVDHLATLNIKDIVDQRKVSFAPLAITIPPSSSPLSASHIEANLVAESARLQSKPQQSTNARDDYWAEEQYDEQHAEQSVSHELVLQQRLAEKKHILDRILYEEEVRQMLKIENIEKNIVAQKAAPHADTVTPSQESDDFWSWRNKNEASREHDAYHANASYWEWPTLSREDEKQQLIQKILKDEDLRQKFSIATIEVQAKASAAPVEQTETSSPNASNDAYWGW